MALALAVVGAVKLRGTVDVAVIVFPLLTWNLVIILLVVLGFCIDWAADIAADTAVVLVVLLVRMLFLVVDIDGNNPLELLDDLVVASFSFSGHGGYR